MVEPLTMSDLVRGRAQRSCGWYRRSDKLLADLDAGKMTAREFVKLSREQGPAKLAPERCGQRGHDVDTRTST